MSTANVSHTPENFQRAHARRGGQITIVAMPQLAEAVVAPRPYRAIIGDSRRVIDSTGNLNGSALCKSFNKARDSFVPTATQTKLSTIALPKGKHLALSRQE